MHEHPFEFVLLPRQLQRLHDVWSVFRKWSLTLSRDSEDWDAVPLVCCGGLWQLLSGVPRALHGSYWNPAAPHYCSFKKKNFGVVNVEGVGPSVFPLFCHPPSLPFSSSQCSHGTCHPPPVSAPGIGGLQAVSLRSAPHGASDRVHLHKSNISVTFFWKRMDCNCLFSFGWNEATLKDCIQTLCKLRWVRGKHFSESSKWTSGLLRHSRVPRLSCDNERSLLCLFLGSTEAWLLGVAEWMLMG